MDSGYILMGGYPLRWTSIPSRGGVAILLGILHAKETGISSGRLGVWLVYTVLVAAGRIIFPGRP